MIEYGLEWHSLASYFQFKEITTPGTPQANQIRLYAKDSSGTSTLCCKNDAGTEVCLPTTAGTLVTGSGAADQVTIWSGASTITGGASAKITNLAGTTALVLKGTPNSFVKIDGNATGNPYLEWAQNGTAQARFQYLDSDDSLALSGGPAAVEQWRFKSDGDLLIGTTIHPVAAVIGRGLAVWKDNNAEIGSYASVAGAGLISGYRAGVFGGTKASPSASITGQGGFYALTARDSSANLYSPALVGLFVAESQTSLARGSYITFDTTALLATTRTERFRVGPSGQWGIGGATFGTAGQYFRSGGASAAPSWATIDHGSEITGLGDDDHTGYALLAGRSGGQTLNGDTTSAGNFTIHSTAHATKGKILIGATGAWDQANKVIGLNSVDPNAITTVPGYFVQGDSSVVFQGRAYGTGAAVVLLAQSSRGTTASPTATQTGDNYFAFNCYGQINTTPGNFGLSAQLFAQATDNFTSTTQGSKWTFATTPIGSATMANAMTIDGAGVLTLHKTAAQLDLSAISAGNPNIKITATSDTPTVVWSALGTNPPSTTPAGYLEILVGASTRYIPFWA